MLYICWLSYICNSTTFTLTCCKEKYCRYQCYVTDENTILFFIAHVVLICELHIYCLNGDIILKIMIK